MSDPEDKPTFRLAYVPGVTPAKWVRVWNERLPDVQLELVAVDTLDGESAARSPRADVGLVRLPVERDGLSVIALYEETPVVVVPRDHVVTAVSEVSLADLSDEIVLHPLDDISEWERPGTPALERPATTADAIELVAAGVGVVVVAQSLARLHHRRDLTYRPVTDAPTSAIALVWPVDETTELVDEFIGIVRGRTANSSRGARASAPSKKPVASTAKPQKQAKKVPAGRGTRSSRANSSSRTRTTSTRGAKGKRRGR